MLRRWMWNRWESLFWLIASVDIWLSVGGYDEDHLIKLVGDRRGSETRNVLDVKVLHELLEGYQLAI